MVSPDRMRLISSPRDWISPSPSVTWSVWPWLWLCHAVRAPGLKWTALTEKLAGGCGVAIGSSQTSPVNISAGPFLDGFFGWISITASVLSRSTSTRRVSCPDAVHHDRTATPRHRIRPRPVRRPTRRRSTTSRRSRVDERGVPLEVARPTVVAVDAGGDVLPPGAVAVDVAVLELDARAARAFRDESDLDLAGVLGVGLDLPRRTDVPAEHDARRRLEHEDARPPALAAVFGSVVDVAADARLERRRDDRCPEHVVLRWLDLTEA